MNVYKTTNRWFSLQRQLPGLSVTLFTALIFAGLTLFSLILAAAVSPAFAQKISDLESEPTESVAAPDVTQVGDWSVVCQSDGGSTCAMTQLGKDSQGSPAIEFVVRKVSEEEAEIDGVKIAAVADIITPLGVLLEFGLRLKIDDGEERGAPFRICQKHGCLVREPLSADVISALKKGGVASVTVAAEGAGPIDIEISLNGFTKAFDSL